MKKIISFIFCVVMCLGMMTTNTLAAGSTVKDGTYTIKNASSGYMMNVYAGKDTNGTKVTTWVFDGTTDQRIYIQHQGNGKYLLKFSTSRNGRVIDVNRGASLTASIDDGDRIDIWTANDLEAQLVYINPCGNNAYTFELVSKPGYVIAAVSNSEAKRNGAQLQLKRYTGASYQQWKLCNTSGAVVNATNSNNSNSNNTTTNSRESQIKSALSTMMNGSSYNGAYKIGVRYSGQYSNEQCKGFAKSVHQRLFGFNIGSTRNTYQINYNSSRTSVVGSTTSMTVSNIKSIFSKARPGDFVQMRQRGSYTGPHSAIVYDVDASGVTLYECNLDWRNTVVKNYYTWSQITSGKSAISVYTAKNY